MTRPPLDHQDAYTPDEDDPDYQYSEAAGYSDWEPPKRNWLRIITIVVSVLVLASMALPMVVMITGAR